MVGARQFDEQEVIAIALDVFWRKGLHDATMQDLAAATGVQRGSLYNAYGDKEAIFLRAFDQYAAQFLDTAARRWRRATFRRGLKIFFDVIVMNMTSGSPAPRLPDDAHRARCGDLKRRRARARAKRSRPAGADRRESHRRSSRQQRPRSTPTASPASSSPTRAALR